MNKERNNIFWHISLPLICISIVIILMLLGFSNKIKSDVIFSFQKNMEEVAGRYAQKIQSELKATHTAGTTVLQVIDQQKEDVAREEKIGCLLQALVDTTEVYAAEYYIGDGEAISQRGKIVDISKKVFYPSIDSNTEAQYLFLREDGQSPSTILILIPNEDKTGTLLLYYPMKRLKSLAKINKEFDQTAFSIIATANGDILQPGDMESNFLNGENLYDNVDKYYYGDISIIKVRMRNGSSGCTAMVASGEARTLIYMPLNINDWTLVLGVNQSYVDTKEMQQWNEIYQMFYQLIAVIILSIAVMTVVNYYGKRRNAEKSRLLQEKADTDLLTGLNNKLATERKIKEYIEENPSSKAMMFVLDIDNFKKINDTMGHAFGDEVLRNLGRHISSNFRVTDIIGRTGGDEFIVLLKNLKDDESVEREARKLVNFFKGFQVGEYVKYSATASIGAAVYPEDGTSFEMLYKSADSALYRAKRQGKNQLAFYDEREIKL